MKTTLWAAVAALALAFAPLANAQEGGRDPFPFRTGPLATTTFNADGTVRSVTPHDLTANDAAASTAAQAAGQPDATAE